MNRQEIERAIWFLERMYVKSSKMLDGRLNGGYIDKDKAENKAIDMAISALTQQLNNGWIPVNSGLPDDRVYPPVICCNTEDEWTDAAIVTEQGKFINSDGCEIYPTHWKLLPESYREVPNESK